MSKTIYVGSKSFELPTQGQEATWGEELSDIIEEMSKTLNTIFGPEDIKETSDTILNNISSPINISGFLFDSSQIKSFESSYNVSRTVSLGVLNFTENNGNVEVECDNNQKHYLDVGDTFLVSTSEVVGYNTQHTVLEVIDDSTIKSDVIWTSDELNSTAVFDVEVVESGIILGNYSANKEWIISQELAGNAYVTFSILSSGQIQYITNNMISSYHIGIMKFKAKALIKV